MRKAGGGGGLYNNDNMIIANTYLPLFAQLFMYVSSLANLCRRRSFSPHFTDQEREADKELGQGYTADNAALGLNPGVPCTATFPGDSRAGMGDVGSVLLEAGGWMRWLLRVAQAHSPPPSFDLLSSKVRC